MEDKQEKYFVGVRFLGSDKTYYYSTKILDLKVGDSVIVDSDGALEAATVFTAVRSAESYTSDAELKPVLRKATPEDMRIASKNEAKAKTMMAVAQQEANRAGLPMDFVAAYLSFNGDVITLVYTSTEKRVDFRDLLPVLGSKLKARVSLRQIASRDRAKMIGGIGICGLPLCCSTFLTTFESIAISKMKNQMLAINIPKYSGPCEKLMCCLAYEDELYAAEKTKFPRINQEVKYQGEVYTVNSFNILSHTVRLSNADHTDFQTFPLEDVLAMIDGTYKPQEKTVVTEKEYKLPDYNIRPSRDDSNSDSERQKQSKTDKNGRNLQEKQQNRGKNNNPPQRSEKDRSGQRHDDRRDQRNGGGRQDGRKDGQRQQPNQQGQKQQPNQQGQRPQQGQRQQGKGGQRPQQQQQPRKERPAGQNGDASNRPDSGEGAERRHQNHHYHHRHKRGNGGGNNGGAGE